MWIKESYSIRRLTEISGYSKFKLSEVKNHWLEQKPVERFDYTSYRYLIYDGTYFHKDGCLICLMNAVDQKIISCIYAPKEGYKSVYPWLLDLKSQGLDPVCITMDGERSVMRAFREVFPNASIQRCLYHIQREGLRWLRSFPKTEAGRALRILLSTLCAIKSDQDRQSFVYAYQQWFETYIDQIRLLPKTVVAYKDLSRTIVLIENALRDMFYFIHNPHIHKTTNAIEGFFSRLKADYRRHRGLSHQHKISYLFWYCFFKNKRSKTHTS